MSIIWMVFVWMLLATCFIWTMMMLHGHLNKDGGNLNYEGYYFLQRLNEIIKLEYPDVMMIAEESSSATKITGMKELGGLGFDYKWNMGWMNDILRFYEEDPIYRKYDFNLVTFSFMYVSMKTISYHFHTMKWFMARRV